MRKKIVAGNWKMNTLPAEGVELAKGVVAGRGEVCSCVNFIVCPPFTHLSMVAEALKGSDIALGAQNCAAEAKGAYTGEVAASMLAALGCKYVILGHSERRQYYGETSATLNKKMEQAYANNLTPIYCVGENLEEREAGKHFDVVKAQIEEVVYNLTEEQFKNLVIAYEPVWAIGTGKTATAEQAQEIHAYIRKVLAEKFGAAAAECPILYGGSCKPANAAEIFAKEDVDGGLIGGAALKAADFLAIRCVAERPLHRSGGQCSSPTSMQKSGGAEASPLAADGSRHQSSMSITWKFLSNLISRPFISSASQVYLLRSILRMVCPAKLLAT